jgi:hypothetical protein
MHAMKDLALDEDDKIDYANPIMSKAPDYPWGLNINFENSTLEKLGIDATKVSVGDVVMMHCLVKITNVGCNEREGPSGKAIEDYRIEGRIEQAAVDGTDDEEKPASRRRLQYAESTS